MKPNSLVRNAVFLMTFATCCPMEFGAPSSMAQTSAPESDAEIAKLVESLVSDVRPTDRYERLQTAGKRATPAFVKLLNDRAKCEVIFNLYGLEMSRLETVAVHLNNEHALEVIAPLAKYLESAKPVFRAAAANGLGRVAAKECVGPMLKAFADDEQKVVDHAIDGIDQAIASEKYSPEFIFGIVPSLEKLVRSRKSNGYDAPRTLAAVDRARATVVFESAEVFALENPNLLHVLNAVGEHGLKLDRGKLLRMIAEIRPKLDDDHNNMIYGRLLTAYGFNPDTSAEAFLRAELKANYFMVKLGAAEGLAAMKGVVNAERFMEQRYRQIGFKGLTPVQRHYYLTGYCDGSLKTFFESEIGDDWKSTLEALDAIGAVEQAKCFRKAIALFAPQVPSDDCAKRNAQMSAFLPERKETLAELDYAFDRYEPRFGVLRALYTVEHPEDFKK